MKVYEQKSRLTYLTTSQKPSQLEPLNGSYNTGSLIRTGSLTSFGQKKIPALFLKSVPQQTSIKEDTLRRLIPVMKYDKQKDAYYTIHVPEDQLKKIDHYNAAGDKTYTEYVYEENQESGTVTETPTRQPTSSELQKQASVLSSLKTYFQLTKSPK